jgi:hypothetical protein
MSTPSDPRLTAEAALLGRLFQSEAVLSPAQVVFLRERGFLPDPQPDPYDYDSENDYYRELEAGQYDDELDTAGERAALRRPRPSRARRALPEWSLAELGRYLGDLLERQRDRLLILTHLAPEADSWDEALAYLGRLDPPALAGVLERTLEADIPFATLWSALTLDTFRQPLTASGPAYRAYLAVVQAADIDQLPGKYSWVLRQDEIGAIRQLLCVQRALVRAAGQLWRTRPAAISRHLRRAPHALALLAHVLLYNSQPAGSEARAWSPRAEAFVSLPPPDHAAAYRRAWTLAVQMDADAILPYLVAYFAGRSEEPPTLLCPAGWNELGYRTRGP